MSSCVSSELTIFVLGWCMDGFFFFDSFSVVVGMQSIVLQHLSLSGLECWSPLIDWDILFTWLHALNYDFITVMFLDSLTPQNKKKHEKMCGCNGMFRCSIYSQMRYMYEQCELTNVIGCFSVRHPVGRAYSREWSSVCTKWLVVMVTTAQWRWDHRPTDPVTTVPATRKSMWTPSPPPG